MVFLLLLWLLFWGQQSASYWCCKAAQLIISNRGIMVLLVHWSLIEKEAALFVYCGLIHHVLLSHPVKCFFVVVVTNWKQAKLRSVSTYMLHPP